MSRAPSFPPLKMVTLARVLSLLPMKLLVEPGEVWYEAKEAKEAAKANAISSGISAEARKRLREKATSLYDEQVRKYRDRQDITPADRQWAATVLKEGTRVDRINAMSLQAQESPFHGLEWIRKLLEMAVSESRHESYPAMDALKSLFLLILPPQALRPRLLSWAERGDLSEQRETTSARALLLAYFEDSLRQAFLDFLKILEIMLHDQVAAGRERGLRILYELVLAYPAGWTESILLRLLVNKLGDPERKIASRVVYYLQMVVERHEPLTLPTVKLVQEGVMKYVPASHQSDKIAYYGLTFFSQLRLSDGASEVTEVLLTTYQHFLQAFISSLENGRSASTDKRRGSKKPARHGRKRARTSDNKDELGGQEGLSQDETPRIVKVVLLGLTRAIPFARADGLAVYGEKLFEIAGRIRSFPTLLQASSLIFRILYGSAESAVNGPSSDSSFDLLATLVSQYLLDCTRMAQATSSHPQLFKLLYKIVSLLGSSPQAQALRCLRAIMKAILTASMAVPSPAFAAATLLLLNEALAMKPALRLAISFPEEQQWEGEEDEERKHKKAANVPGDDHSLYWELLVLARYAHPTIRKYALALLQPNGEIDISNEPDDPFQSLSVLAFLESFIKGTVAART